MCWDRLISLVLSLFNLAALVWWHLHLGRLTVLAAQLGNTAEDINRTPVPRLVLLRAGTIGVEQDGGSVERVDLTAAYGVEEEGQRERVEPFETPVSTAFSGDASIGRMRDIGSGARRELYAGQGDAPPAYLQANDRRLIQQQPQRRPSQDGRLSGAELRLLRGRARDRGPRIVKKGMRRRCWAWILRLRLRLSRPKGSLKGTRRSLSWRLFVVLARRDLDAWLPLHCLWLCRFV